MADDGADIDVVDVSGIESVIGISIKYLHVVGGSGGGALDAEGADAAKLWQLRLFDRSARTSRSMPC
jgi:hypothetical protein